MFSLIRLIPNTLYHKVSGRAVNTLSPLATAFNSKPEQHKSIFGKKTGIFGIEELAESGGFYLLQENAIQETDQLLLESCSSTRKRKIVEIFDHLSNTLCKVADLAEFVRMVLPNYKNSPEAEHACQSIGGLVEKLNTHKPLYDSLKEVILNGDKFETTDVDDHVAKLFLFDFEQSGIHLDEDKRKQVTELNQRILMIGQHFLDGTLVPRVVPKEMLPEGIRQYFKADGDNLLVGSMFSTSSLEVVREAAYKIYLHPDAGQESLLMQLLEARHEMASLCGFPSLAHRAVRSSLAETPELVHAFLTQLSKEIKLPAQNEFQEMTLLKKQICKTQMPLASWDVPYLTSIARQRSLPSSYSNSFQSYFSLGTVMDGLNSLFEDIFNVSLTVETPLPGEVWSDTVYKLAVMYDSTELLGHIYCDFFDSEYKPHQDCHFTIRGGKVLDENTYQNPIVVLHLNLPSPTWSTPSLLSLSMVENLFHEMGHAMHSMFARTRYQHVTGTRCSTDFAEVPSLLMEYFANDPRVLYRIGRHYKTGQRLPMNVIEKVLASKYTYSAIELQLQNFYSLLDQRYYGTERWSSDVSTSDILADIQRDNYGLPYVPNTAWQLRFGHLVGYGAKYYAYLMSRAVASWIWQKEFAENPFNRAAGKRLYDEVLRHGGGKPPKHMVAELLGRKVTPENLVSALMTDLHHRKSMFIDKEQPNNI